MVPSKGLSSNEVVLLFVKANVYLHPTTSKKDNVPGYLTLSKGPQSANTDILLSFTPETQLSKKDASIYERANQEGCDPDLKTKSGEHSKASKQLIVSKPPISELSGYSFSTPLSFIYSIQVRMPSLGFWFGSFVIYTKNGEKLPIVFFHDDLQSTSKNQDVNSFLEGFEDSGGLLWGGKQFMDALGKVINVEKSELEPSVYLINPDSTDLRNFAPYKKPGSQQNQSKQDPFKMPDINKFISTAKWKVLETVATLTAKGKSLVLDIVEEHAPTPVKHVLKLPEVHKVGNDFDSARVYLAKWAQQVKQEAEMYQNKYMLDEGIYNSINKELGSSEYLTEEEVNSTSRRKEISKSEWESFFDYSGRLCITVHEVKNRIFHGGLEDSIRGEAWLFLLNLYPWDSSREEREALKSSYETSYEEYKLKWVNDDDKRNTEYWKDQKHRIEKDIHRTDRQLPIFRNKKSSDSSTSSASPETGRESSPETPDEDAGEEEDNDDEFNLANIRNPHLFTMREILLTYNEYNVNLGYVQGMTDLLSPLYVKIRSEALTFWAFSKFMERMERNFVRDQSGMRIQMTTLNRLLQFMLPNLYKHLEKCEAIDLFFFFRMLLVWFKRELDWNDVLRLWEILWTDYYTSQFHLFFALAVLSDNERIIVQNLKQFDEVLKYMNDLSMKLQLDPLLIRSELLFLKFSRMIDIIDRDNGMKRLEGDPYGSNDSTEGVVEIGDELRQLLSKDIIIQKEVERSDDFGGG